MPKNNYWIRSGSYVFLQRISALIFGFGSYIYLVRYYEPKVFGVWALFIVITSIIEMSRSAFIQNALVKFYSQPDVNRVELIKASFYLNFLSNVFFVVLLIILIPVLQSFWHTEAIGPLMLWYCVTSTILVPFTQLNYVEQASHSFKGIFWSTAVRQGLFFVLVTVAFYMREEIPLSLSAFAGLQAFCALAGLLVAWKLSASYVPKEVMSGLFKVNWGEVRRIFRFGKYILGVGATSSIGKSTDQFLLGNVDTGVAAIYNAAIRIINFIEVPTYSISNVVYPKIAEKANLEGKKGVGEMYEKSVAYMVAIIIPAIVGIAFLPDLALLIMAGEEYVKAASVLRLIVLAAILFPLNVQVGSAFEVIGKPQISFGINFASNILNLMLNLYMVPRYGAMGAAWTLIATSLSIFVVSQVMLYMEFRVNLMRILISIPAAYGVIYQEVMHKLKRK